MPAMEIGIDWVVTADVTDRVRRKLSRLVKGLGPVLNEYEAMIFDMSHLATNGLDYLMPKVELSLPLYEERQSFRLRMWRMDGETVMLIETKTGEKVAEAYLA